MQQQALLLDGEIGVTPTGPKLPKKAVKRGKVWVTIDKKDRQTVVATGDGEGLVVFAKKDRYKYPRGVDFADGAGTRYLGVAKCTGEVYDAASGQRLVRAENAQTPKPYWPAATLDLELPGSRRYAASKI